MEIEIEKTGRIIRKRNTIRLEKVLNVYQKDVTDFFQLLFEIGISMRDVEYFKSNIFKGMVIGSTFFIQSETKKYSFNLISTPSENDSVKVKLSLLKRYSIN